MTVNAITDTKKGEQGLRLLIFILPKIPRQNSLQAKFGIVGKEMFRTVNLESSP